jgi:hypothetical protein
MTGGDVPGPDALNAASVSQSGERSAPYGSSTGSDPGGTARSDQEAPAVHHDDVLLSAEEEAVFVELSAALLVGEWLAGQLGGLDDGSWPPEIPAQPCDCPARRTADPADDAERPGSLRYLLLAMIGVVALVGGGGLAAFTSGVAAWCGMLTWTIGIVVTLCAVVTGEAARPHAPLTRRSACPSGP